MPPTFAINPYRVEEHECHCGGTCGHCGDAATDPNVAQAGAALALVPPTYYNARGTQRYYADPTYFVRAAGEPLSPNMKTGLYVAGGLAAAVAVALAYRAYAKPAKKGRGR